jgi:hypothetical protein
VEWPVLLSRKLPLVLVEPLALLMLVLLPAGPLLVEPPVLGGRLVQLQ